MKVHWLELFKGMGIATLFFIGIALIIIGPFLTIWSLNTLFGLTIVYTFKTWFATLVLHSLFGGTARAKDMYTKVKE